MHVRQSKIATRISVGESLVVKAKQVEHRGVQIMDRHAILNGPKTEFVRGS